MSNNQVSEFRRYEFLKETFAIWKAYGLYIKAHSENKSFDGNEEIRQVWYRKNSILNDCTDLEKRVLGYK